MTLMRVPVIDIAPYRNGTAPARAGRQPSARPAATSASWSSPAMASPDLIVGVERSPAPSSICRWPEKMRVPRPAPDVTRGYIPIEARRWSASRGAVRRATSTNP